MTFARDETDPFRGVARRGHSYGWVVVGIAFLTQFLLTGCVFYSFSVALTALADEFGGGDRTGVSLAQAAMMPLALLLSPVVGWLVGRGWFRSLMTVGTLCTGLGLLLLSRATSLWQVYLVFGTLFMFGGVTMTGICPSALVVNWFDKLRATALGISQLGASLGGMVMGPVAGQLLESRGWRGTYVLFGIAVLLAVPVVWGLTVGRPRDGTDLLQSAPGDAAAFSVGWALRQRNFWLIAIVNGIAFMLSAAMVTHVVAFATDKGIDTTQASFALSLLAGGAAAGKLLFGWLSDRAGERPAFGSYAPAFWTFVAVLAGAIVLLRLLDLPRRTA